MAVTVALIGSVAGCGDDQVTSARWPEVTVERLVDGSAVDSAALEGFERRVPTVVAVWAVWCTPCRKELPVLAALAAERSDRLAVLALNHGDDPGNARDFLDEIDVDIEAWRDPDARLVSRLGIASLPATVIVDAQGAIRWQRVGVVTEAELRSALDDLEA